MTMAPSVRKFALIAHIVSSIGWFGAVAAFLALVVTGLTSQDTQLLRGVYLLAKPITWFVVVPLALASLLTGIVQSLGTTWGLFRHYWVSFKLVLTVLATVVLLRYMQTVSYFASVVTTADGVDNGGLQSYFLHSVGGMLVLLVITALSVYKPRGMTPYGWRKQHEGRAGRSDTIEYRVEQHLEKPGDRLGRLRGFGRDTLASVRETGA